VTARDLRIVPLVGEFQDEIGSGRCLPRNLDARADEARNLDRSLAPREAEDAPETRDPRGTADESPDCETGEETA
jgi:hypothetical protein